MAGLRFQSRVEQLAAHLRGELQRGRWGREMPGRHQLAYELGTNPKIVESALRLLEQEQWLIPQGAGRRRRIAAVELPRQALRIAVLHFEPATRGVSYMVELMHQLNEAGHVAFPAKRTLVELGMKVPRVARLVAETPADAWIVGGGSREILTWFTRRDAPVFTIFGRRRGLPIAGAGPDKPPAMMAMTRRLIELGHRRIVLLAREERRKPVPGATERAFLQTLAAGGLSPGPYHLPDWEESPAGFQSCLEGLFHLTPPTGLIVDEAPFFTAAMQFFCRRGIRVPEDVSLLCCDADPHFAWCQPPVSHIRWDSRPVVARILRWARHISQGIDDRRQTETKAEFVEGATIGPAA